MTAFVELERLDRRVLGALRCVDLASGAGVDVPLTVSAPGARLQRNPSGLYVITGWDTLAEHAAAFDAQPDDPAPGDETLVLTVRDTSGRYLPRLVSLDLPRDPDPAHAENSDSLFRPVEVPLYPSPAAPTGANWAVLRVTVTASGSGDALGGALVRVQSDGKVIARGLTDWRGEALVPVVGIPVTTWSDDPDAVIVSEIAATVEAAFDPAVGVRTPIDQVRQATPPAALPLVDPAALDTDFSTLPRTSTALGLAAGRPYPLSLQIALP